MKNIGEKVLGWFIVPEDGVSPPPAAAPPQPRDHQPVPPSHISSSFDAIYRAKGLPDFDCERLAKVLDLLASLPREATQDVKRAIVGAALSAFGVPIDRIIATATTASVALDAHAMETERQTSDVIDRGQSRIEQLSHEISEIRLAMEHERSAQDDRIQSIAHEKTRVHAAIDFFGNGVQSSLEKPRLVRLK